MGEGDTFVNALVGAAVTVVTVSLVPFSPLLGGAVSGYLEGGDTRDALRVGALSGLLALIPVLLLFIFLGNVALVFFAGTGGEFPLFAAGIGAFVVLAVLVGLLYIMLLSAVGGWVGLYLKQEEVI